MTEPISVVVFDFRQGQLVVLTLGIAVWVGAWPMMIVPVAVLATTNWVHIPFEEGKMRRQFGASYDDYVKRVRRWV
jgi:protein-S-isoprenylcysteine O-methyltransferase Ste14